MNSLKAQIEKIAQFGREADGGISRVFGSTAMQQGIRQVRAYFHECHMESYVDTAGNVHGILKGTDPESGEILVGSHLDTVKEGGMFDGVLGLVAGAECARRMYEEKIPHGRDLHIIATNGEEGNELGGTFGSRAMMGLLPLSSPEFCEKAKKYGFSKEDLEAAALDTGRAKAYLELHIEQGPTLYHHGEKIGIVTGIVGLRRYKAVVHGQSNHAGTTMMEDRNDALVSAARILLMGDRLAREIGHHFVETVGIMNVYPGSAPVIPNRTEMVLEIRSDSEERMDQFIESFQNQAEAIARTEISLLVEKQPVQCERSLTAKLEEICIKKKLPYRKMPSGATHDGNAFAARVPIGMIFVPSVNGISHAREEWTNWEDALLGMDVLYELLKKLVTEEEGKC